MAEREGFEPPDLSVNGFQDRRHKPLGHLSGEPILGADPIDAPALGGSARVLKQRGVDDPQVADP